jgi:hypothetical protein
MDKYQERGYANRQDYLRWLAINYEVPIDIVLAAADLLGPYASIVIAVSRQMK